MKKILIFLLLILSVACDDQRKNFDGGIIPPVPVNFSEVNSAYDDYNSDLPIIWNWKSFSLIFSTNRNSFGNDFDFIGYNCSIESDLVTGEFSLQTNSRNFSMVDAINSPNNELGPYFTRDLDYHNYNYKEGGAGRFFYTSDRNGNNDIYFTYYTIYGYDFLPSGDPAELTGINTGFNEGYLTIHYGETLGRESVYFTSDRDNSYDIYRAVSEENKLIDQSPGLTVNKVEQLSSSADDKCPYINGNMMVFTSDRDGGFGGFDLWYSLYDGQGWSAPVNFGENINSEYDEYRPVIVSTYSGGFLNDMLIFSSNRPGGKGLFDLYYVGVTRRNGLLLLD
ncbi:MAG: hypothetical protein E4H43_03485 [Bacteroidia bacterium]|nr:MAG: hypothetical protein E4H43_03485 [Bacteroidia bacterium]